MSLDYLITGTGRCGTLFLAKLLNSVGIPCGHECVFNHQGRTHASRNSVPGVREGLPEKPPPLRAESSLFAAPYLPIEAKVIHVVRHPLQVVRSFVRDLRLFSGGHPELEKFVVKSLPGLSGPPLEKAAQFYVRWNRMIEPHASLFFRIEDDPKAVLDFLVVDCQSHFADKDCNAWGKRHNQSKQLTWDDIKDPELKEMSRRYGYD